MPVTHCQIPAVRARRLGPGTAQLHIILVGPEVDARDGCTRTAGSNAITDADGDEVRITSGGGTLCHRVGRVHRKRKAFDA